MISTYRKEKSLHGHSLDVLKSGLQKYIRRGNIEGAMYCLGELDYFSECGQEGKRIRTNMIHRLMIIFIEDIGLAGIELWGSHIDPLVTSWLKDRTRIDALKCLVHIMCQAPKTRACSFAKAYAISTECTEDDFERAVKNKEWSALILYFKMLKADDSMKTYRELGTTLEKCGVSHIPLAMKWTREIKTKERSLILLLPLLAHIFGSYKYTCEDEVKYENSWKEHISLPTRVFEDFVYDKHVRGGDARMDFWLHTSSSVTNEVFIVPELFRDIYYKRHKTPQQLTTHKHVETNDRESDYSLIVRCQLVCSRSKTDTVMAKTPNGKLVFMKGPFANEATVLKFLDFQKLKKARGIPAVDGHLKYLLADRWPHTPLGIRNQLDLNKPWPFLICEAVFEEKDMVIRTRASKLWPETPVLDTVAMKLTVDPFSLDEKQVKEYIDAIKFRIEYNLGDFADRNFLLGKDGHIYSVDEEVCCDPVDLEKCLGKRKFELIRPFLART